MPLLKPLRQFSDILAESLDFLSFPQGAIELRVKYSAPFFNIFVRIWVFRTINFSSKHDGGDAVHLPTQNRRQTLSAAVELIVPGCGSITRVIVAHTSFVSDGCSDDDISAVHGMCRN